MEATDPVCLFCQIARHDRPATVVFESDTVLAFRDIRPKAPTHLLIIPKQHISTIDDLADADRDLAATLLLTARDLARQLQIAATGYRLVFNVKNDGGQEVDHLHLHLIGGQQLEPMA